MTNPLPDFFDWLDQTLLTADNELTLIGWVIVVLIVIAISINWELTE